MINVWVQGKIFFLLFISLRDKWPFEVKIGKMCCIFITCVVIVYSVMGSIVEGRHGHGNILFRSRNRL